MDFFKSILSEEDPDPPSTESTQPDSIQDPSNPNPNSSSSSPNLDSSWSFGGFMKTLSTRSESVIETYRRDLEEFRTGLQKETELFKEAATRAVKELPGSIEVGASVAQGMIKSTAEIVSQGKNLLIENSDNDNDDGGSNVGVRSSVGSGIYSRFDAQLRAIQCDVGSYVEDPEDTGEYEKWKEGFVLEEKREEVERVREESGEVEGMFGKLVESGEVEEGVFWCRYMFRVWELKRRENVREMLVKRAIEVDDEEELSWDVDDDEEEDSRVETEERNVGVEGNESGGGSGKEAAEGVKGESLKGVDVSGSERKVDEAVDEGNVVEKDGEGVKVEVVSSEVSNEKSELKVDENVSVKGINDAGESSKESEGSVVPARSLSREEEYLEWDEIDDVEGSDEKKVSHDESASKADARKRLTVAEDDEDLSWDIDDDDEPEKAGAK
ncbi:BSD domain-containing protein [Heracleum sosnowskyi]|uniref:BSD domain-containing protein n=1 Tax=Heracleum sosnowskyi TaxID=360622 RepID=A0AAD8GZM3_9APIA|nr:BSD domain-containing protein [Heracleum sosnowskyi]